MTSPLDDRPELGLLMVSVPMAIAGLRGKPESWRLERAREAGQFIAEHGDDLLFRGRPGRSAVAFAQMSYGLAALAYQPGGVTFAGMHWCTDHEACKAAAHT